MRFSSPAIIFLLSLSNIQVIKNRMFRWKQEVGGARTVLAVRVWNSISWKSLLWFDFFFFQNIPYKKQFKKAWVASKLKYLFRFYLCLFIYDFSQNYMSSRSRSSPLHVPQVLSVFTSVLWSPKIIPGWKHLLSFRLMCSSIDSWSIQV